MHLFSFETTKEIVVFHVKYLRRLNYILCLILYLFSGEAIITFYSHSTLEKLVFWKRKMHHFIIFMLEKNFFRFYICGTCFYRCSLLDCLFESGRSRFFVWVHSTFCVCVRLLHIVGQPSCTVTVDMAHGGGHLWEFYTHFLETGIKVLII